MRGALCSWPVKLLAIYQGLSEPTRLRILNLLGVSPLCVCHLQKVLAKPQVNISQHLAYLRERAMVSAQKHQSWMVYSLPTAPTPELVANLRCLQESAEPVLREDRRKLAKLMEDKSLQELLEADCRSVKGGRK